MTDTQTSKGQPGLVQAALFGLCPNCGAKTLFAGPARFADRCGNCGLDYSTLLVVSSLRFAQGALLVAEHRNRAVEGRLVESDEIK